MNKSETLDFIASEYDAIQRATTPCIVKLLEQISLLPVNSSTGPIKVIDLASGPAVLAILLGEAYSQVGYLDKITFLSSDFSPKMVELAERRFASHNWSQAQFSFRTFDAANLVGVPSRPATSSAFSRKFLLFENLSVFFLSFLLFSFFSAFFKSCF